MTAAEVTTEVVTAVVEAQFRELAPARAAYLNEGCDSAAFVINDTWVFRFPKREDVERQLAIETRVLARLEERSPLTVPAFRFHGRPSAAFPFHFVGYARIPGVPGIQLAVDQVPFDGVAATLGRFLTWLHAMPIEPAERLGVPRCEIERFVEECGSEALADFETVARVSPSAPLEEWRAFLLARPDLASISEGPPSLLHNDFAAEHLLFDPSPDRISGVVDWSDMAIGQSVADFAGVFHWGGEALIQAVTRAYGGPISDGFVACARYLAACRGVGDVVFGARNNRPEYFAAGLRALAMSVPGRSRQMRSSAR